MNTFVSIGGKKALVDYLATRQFHAALFTASARLGDTREKYSPENELPQEFGYDTGGIQLKITANGIDGTTAYLAFANPTWSNASFSGAQYLEIYDRADLTSYGIIDFGAAKDAQGADFTYKFPAAGGVIRI